MGDQAITYALAPDVESRYRLFVPEDWKPGDRWPLVVMLHGGGSDENNPFDAGEGFTARLFAAARAHRFILLSPRGHKGGWGTRMVEGGTGPLPRGTYRWPPPGAKSGPLPKVAPRGDRDVALAQQDVFETIGRVERAYGTLPHPYLMGNSMGGQGTLHLAQADPDRWCAIAPSDGPFDPASYPYERARRVRAALFVQGDDDHVVPAESMLAIASGFERVGVPTRLMVIPGGTHTESWHVALPAIFAFFASRPCDAHPVARR